METDAELRRVKLLSWKVFRIEEEVKRTGVLV